MYIFIFLLLLIIFAYKNVESFESTNVNYPADKIVYVFWTGNNEMTETRRKCLDSIYDNIGVEVKLITPKNLNQYIKKDYPLHKAYEHLSYVHRTDYLRTYFMHHYGGGYTDIKNTTVNWEPFFDNLNKNNNYIVNGYTEIEGGSGSTNPEISKNYKKLIGNGSYVFKKNTKLTQEWIDILHKKLDKKYDLLLKNPPLGSSDYLNCTDYSSSPSKYPIQWTELLGQHFHDVIYKYRDQILHDLPLIDIKNYR
jgi:hypothetical protein